MPRPARRESDKDDDRTQASLEEPDYDALVISAGVCGIYMAYRLRAMGRAFTVIERGGDVGGNWYWNRYPGCRFDSESETYGYSFSKELLQEWDWRERFSAREDTERYFLHVTEKFGLREHMQFGLTVTAATWNEAGLHWRVALTDGRTLTARFVLTAIGLPSRPTPPRYIGRENFGGCPSTLTITRATWIIPASALG